MTSEQPEKAVSGRSLYETDRSVRMAFGDLFHPVKHPVWDELSWREQDDWEAKADEINESRRGTP